MEHVGKHLEKATARTGANSFSVEQEDDDLLVNWALRERIIERKAGGGYKFCVAWVMPMGEDDENYDEYLEGPEDLSGSTQVTQLQRVLPFSTKKREDTPPGAQQSPPEISGHIQNDETPPNALQSKHNLPVYNITGATSDSGYASLGQAHGIQGDNYEDCEDETQTVFTDNQELHIEEDVEEKLASAISNEILQRLQDVLGAWSETAREWPMTTALADSLKEFSIRLRSNATQENRKIPP